MPRLPSARLVGNGNFESAAWGPVAGLSTSMGWSIRRVEIIDIRAHVRVHERKIGPVLVGSVVSVVTAVAVVVVVVQQVAEVLDVAKIFVGGRRAE